MPYEGVSKYTIYRRIREGTDFDNYWAATKPFINERNRQRRIEWSCLMQPVPEYRSLWSLHTLFLQLYLKTKGDSSDQRLFIHSWGGPHEWMTNLWSDESPFVLRYSRKKRVWRLHNERYSPKCTTIGTVKHDVKIMVWRSFGVGILLRALWSRIST